MNKKTKALYIGIGLILVASAAILVYFRFFALSTYRYTTAKGQQYSLKYFPRSKIVDSARIAEELSNSEIKAGTPMLVAYLKDDLGIMVSITDAIDKPLTKSCTGTDRFAFSVNEYEVCKLVSRGQTASLLAKVGNDGKYFVVTASTVYNGKRILKDKDRSYAENFNEFDILQYQNKLETIFKSIRPLN